MPSLWRKPVQGAYMCVLLSSDFDVIAHGYKSVLEARAPLSPVCNTGSLAVHHIGSQSMWLLPQVQQETSAKCLQLGNWISVVRQCKCGNSWQNIQSLKLNRSSRVLNFSVFPLTCGHLYAAYFPLTEMSWKSLSTSTDMFGLEFGIEAHTEVWTLTSVRAQVSMDWQCD